MRSVSGSVLQVEMSGEDENFKQFTQTLYYAHSRKYKSLQKDFLLQM